METFLIIGFILLPVVLMAVMLPMFLSHSPVSKAEREKDKENYTYIYIENGALVRKAQGLSKEVRIPLREIQQIKFSAFRDWNIRNNRGIWGHMTISLKSSNKTVEITYCSDIYYQHYIFVSTLRGTTLATDMLMEQLSAHNIHCFKDESFDTIKEIR